MRRPNCLRREWVICALLVVASAAVRAADDAVPEGIPAGYRLQYSQDFESPDAFEDFDVTFLSGWRLATKEDNTALEFFGKHNYKPPVRSPRTIGLVRGRRFGSFVLDVDLLQTGREYGHRDMCLFLNFVDPSKFYYCHLATKADPNAHNIFIVNDKPRTNIAIETTKGIQWGQDQWHHLRLVRDVDSGRIEVYYDDMSKPIMVAEDSTHGQGLIGFGSFDDSGKIDNIRIYAPAVSETDKVYFHLKRE